MIKRLQSFFRSLADLFGRVKDSEPIAASQTLILTRLNICAACPSYRSHIDTCSECYCVMHIKARLLGEECPLSKW